jgi:hypothetical protein
LAYDHDDNQCWALYFDLEVDDPAAWAGDLQDPDDVDAAQAWAGQLLHDGYDIEVTGWTDGQLLPGYPARIAVFAGAGEVGVEQPEQSDDVDAAPAGPGEYRLLYDPVDGIWLLLADAEPLGDQAEPRPAPAPNLTACKFTTATLGQRSVGGRHSISRR